MSYGVLELYSKNSREFVKKIENIKEFVYSDHHIKVVTENDDEEVIIMTNLDYIFYEKIK